MDKIPINVQKVRNILADINDSLEELKVFSGLTPEEFKKDKSNYGLAEHYLRRVLEGILTIGSHFLSRFPAKTRDYQQIILSLSEYGIIPVDFAEKNKKLAGYRNRLVHIYWEVSRGELLQVIKEHLVDLYAFIDYFSDVLKHPDKYGLTIEK
ncbi:hypothetical protein BMS3Abin07_00621 [bacterium BMS3Abin07]|nr:hypothetical protein BMS3Abin07_00621 [bacterium BMS3Abin07]GBE31288.1 hypothetical protein BMS3Bbin05_00187 [bacterium BMS3Bbin05]